MKKFLVLIPLIMLSSGCVKPQEQQCPSCKESCKENLEIKTSEIPELDKHPIDIEEEKCKIADSQKKWENYIKSEFDVNENIIYNKVGTIYYTIAADQKRELIKQRALLLKNYVADVKEP